MNSATTAILLIGFQNDYFSKNGIIHDALEDDEQVGLVLSNTLKLLDKLSNTKALIIATPTYFSTGYPELKDPVGILKIIKDNGAFVAGSEGANTIDDIEVMSDRIMTLPSKRGLNCFSNTDLQPVLQARGIQDVIIAGAMTSLCIDTAGREAYDLGYRVHILKDCIVARTAFERKFYSDEIMPLYAEVVNSSGIEWTSDC